MPSCRNSKEDQENSTFCNACDKNKNCDINCLHLQFLVQRARNKIARQVAWKIYCPVGQRLRGKIKLKIIKSICFSDTVSNKARKTSRLSGILWGNLGRIRLSQLSQNWQKTKSLWSWLGITTVLSTLEDVINFTAFPVTAFSWNSCLVKTIPTYTNLIG